jgi:DNA-binding MarR family transcriptional regulator
MREAAQAEEQVLDFIRQTPGMGTSAIARQLQVTISSTSNRLRRLEQCKLIQRDADGGYAILSP